MKTLTTTPELSDSVAQLVQANPGLAMFAVAIALMFFVRYI